jgi:hypothetical protein
MSQSESDRRAEEAKARAKAEAASRGRELSDAELETIAAAGDDGSKSGPPPGKKAP